MKRLIVGIFIIFSLLFLPLFSPVSAALPLTGTFVVPDISYSSESEYAQFFQELANSGMTTIILTLTGSLSKNCATGAYTEYVDMHLFGNFFPIAVKLAKQYGMRIYFSLAGYPVSTTCFTYYQGSTTDESTDKGRLIGMSKRSITALKILVTELGINWSDPAIAGFYLAPEGDTRWYADQTSGPFLFVKDLASIVKTMEPTKKIMLSPYQKDAADYTISKLGFTNLFSATKVDIIAPQDSMGTEVTTSFQKSAEHFRALRDAHASFPQKQAWANIEIFQKNPTGEAYDIPADITRIKNQIAAVSPYISTMITWLYPHTMLMNNLSDTVASKNIYAPMYTPVGAVLRTTLRRNYFMAYGVTTWSIQSVTASDQSISVTGIFGPANTTQRLLFLYMTTDGKTKRISWQTKATGQSQQSQIPLSKAPSIDRSKPYTAYVVDSNFPTYNATNISTSPADFDGNGTVNIIDFVLYMNYWWVNNLSKADFNTDGKINAIDYTIFMNYWHDSL